jgi:hypothetical protein
MKLGLVAVVLVAACGRSDPHAVGCPAREGLVCTDLAKARVDTENQFVDDTQKNDGNAAAADGACDASLVDLELQRSCIADRCAELCTLVGEPGSCGVVGGGDCALTCTTLKLNDDVLDIALDRAAHTPGFCSCNVCVDDTGKTAKDGTAALCTSLFVCPTGK